MSLTRSDFKQVHKQAWAAHHLGHNILVTNSGGKLKLDITADIDGEMDPQQWIATIHVANQFFQRLRVAEKFQ